MNTPYSRPVGWVVLLRRNLMLVAAALLSVALHLLAILGTPRFDLAWLYEEEAPAPIEARLLPLPPEKPLVAPPRKRPPRATRKPASVPVSKPMPAELIHETNSPSATIAAEPTPGDVQAPPGEAGSAQAEPDSIAPPSESEYPALAARYPLRRAKLIFDLYYGESKTLVGEVTHTWSQADGRYVAESKAEAVGFVSLFFSGDFTHRSEGVFNASGLVPSLYTFTQRDNRNETASFEWHTGKLLLQRGQRHKELALREGAQDVVSVMHQLYFMQPLPQNALLSVATSRRLDIYVFQFVGEEQFVTPSGLVRAAHVKRQEPDGTITEVWLDMDRYLLPAKIYSVNNKGYVLEQVVRQVAFDASTDTLP